MTLRQAVVFSILMENGNGILDKSSGYIKEKLSLSGAMEFPERLLDKSNFAKFKEWQKKWDREFKPVDSMDTRII